jgi:NADH-quinone oxidoreductase subunit N
MTIFMLSLAGFPPSVGFFGKFFLFAAGINAGYTWLVVVAVLMSVVSVYYYFRVLLHVWSLTPVRLPRITAAAGVSAAVAVTAVASLLLGIFPAVLLAAGQHGATGFLGP